MVKGKRCLILGLGTSGQDAMHFLQKRGALTVGYDDKKKVPMPDLESMDLLVVSPGVPRTHPIYTYFCEQRQPIIGEMELGFREIKKPVLGITGTNGKTTVTLLTTHVLNQCGIRAKAIGNMGYSVTRAVDDGDEVDCYVAEISSFQLETMQTPVLTAAALLNVSQDHLDRYRDFTEYTQTKFLIRSFLKEGGSFFLIEELYKEAKIPDAYKARSEIELKNLFASYLLTEQLGVTAEKFWKAVESFKLPEHRMEFVAEVGGVRFYNDSKGTNVDATLQAVKAVKGDIFLIAGGQSKGADFSPWKEALKKRVKCLFAIGEAQEEIGRLASQVTEVKLCDSLQQAFFHAQTLAKSGDTVLLSPGCASFDQFANFAERGKLFKSLVRQLEEGKL